MSITTDILTYRSGLFELDSMTKHPVRGYTAGELWNGWACPYFEKAAADDLIEQLNASYERFGESWQALYDPARDVYITPYDGGDDEWDIWGAETIQVGSQALKVYSIGLFNWCWIEVQG